MPATAAQRLVVLAPDLFRAGPGGIQTVAAFLVRVAASAGGVEPFLVSANDPTDSCGAAARGAAFGARYGKLLWWCWRSARRAIGPAAGIVCLHAGLLPAARLLSRTLGCPYVLYLHGLEVWRRPRWRERWGGTYCAGLLANSACTLERAQSAQPWLRPRPACVTHLGLLAPIEGPNPGFAERQPNVLAVGQVRRGELRQNEETVRYGKGFHVLFDAVALLQSRGEPVGFDLITGGDGLDVLRQDLARRGLRERVRIRVDVSAEELDAAYRQARAFCLPSAQEGFGLVYTEAMARGTPSVCVQAGAAPEIVRDGESGFVVPPDDAAALAQRLNVLVREEAAWRPLNAGAWAAAHDRFGPAQVHARHLLALQNLLGLRRDLPSFE